MSPNMENWHDQQGTHMNCDKNESILSAAGFKESHKIALHKSDEISPNLICL